MKRSIVIPISFIFIPFFFSAQSAVQSLNTGAISNSLGSISVGEIIIPQTNTQSSNGFIGIISVINQQTLEVGNFEIFKDIVAYPNPTSASIAITSEINLIDEKVFVYNNSGQLVSQNKISADHLIDLNNLPNGIYMIEFENKKYKSLKVIKK